MTEASAGSVPSEQVNPVDPRKNYAEHLQARSVEWPRMIPLCVVCRTQATDRGANVPSNKRFWCWRYGHEEAEAEWYFRFQELAKVFHQSGFDVHAERMMTSVKDGTIFTKRPEGLCDFDETWETCRTHECSAFLPCEKQDCPHCKK